MIKLKNKFIFLLILEGEFRSEILVYRIIIYIDLERAVISRKFYLKYILLSHGSEFCPKIFNYTKSIKIVIIDNKSFIFN